jgi:hypothetical protein
MSTLMLGAIAMASLTATVFFLRFWRDTRDRFFLFFAIAFLIDALNRVILGLKAVPQEHEPFFYVVRLCSYMLIIAAIVDKNRPRSARGTDARARSLAAREKS